MSLFLLVHRWLVTEKKLLHRDLSFNNVLIPIFQQEPEASSTEIEGVGTRPRFVDEIVESRYAHQLYIPFNPQCYRTNAPSHALLCDLDNAVNVSEHNFQLSFYEGVTHNATEDWTIIPTSAPSPKPVIVMDHNNPGCAELAKRTVSGLRLGKHLLLIDRQGTPMFIARAVAQGCLQRYSPIRNLIPTLPGGIKVSYEKVHATDSLRLLEDDENHVHGCPTTLHPETYTLDDDVELRKAKFFHHPRYDAESVFWIALVFLLRVQPSGNTGDTRRKTERKITAVTDTVDDADEEQDEKDDEEFDFEEFDFNSDFEELESHLPQESFMQPSANSDEANKSDRQRALDAAWNNLVSHEISRASADSRELLLMTTDWQQLFNEQFSFLGPMFKELAAQVKPEYAYLDPQPNPLHLHEAMQRIFLRAIYYLNEKLCDPCLLSADLRPVHVRQGPARLVKGIIGMSSRKRTLVNEEIDSRKKQKTK